MRHLPPTDRDVHAAGGALRRPTAMSTQQAVHFGTQTPAAGFVPRNAARTLPHSSPTCGAQEANLFI